MEWFPPAGESARRIIRNRPAAIRKEHEEHFSLVPAKAGGRTAQAAQHAELAVVDVGNLGAAVRAGRVGIELEDFVEEE